MADEESYNVTVGSDVDGNVGYGRSTDGTIDNSVVAGETNVFNDDGSTDLLLKSVGVFSGALVVEFENTAIEQVGRTLTLSQTDVNADAVIMYRDDGVTVIADFGTEAVDSLVNMVEGETFSFNLTLSGDTTEYVGEYFIKMEDPEADGSYEASEDTGVIKTANT